LPIRVPEPLIPVFLKVTRANRAFVSEAGAHQRIRERALRPEPYGPPTRLEGVRVDRRLPNPLAWPVYDVEPADRAQNREGRTSVVVYVHGGGWVNEIRFQHWQLTARVARESRQRVVVPIYPLVPFGTAREVRDGVVELVRAELDAGNEVRLAGDSAGGQIALSVALELRDQGIVLPSTTLLSPALDLSWKNPRIDAVQPSDPWLGRPGGRVLAEAWRGADPIEDPVVSPLFGDMSGLGPLTVLTGTRDVLNPDAQLLRAKVRAAGGQMAWHEAEGQLHVYALLPTEAGEQGMRTIVESLQPTDGMLGASI
jgi:acetyl esterase/lipase